MGTGHPGPGTTSGLGTADNFQRANLNVARRTIFQFDMFKVFLLLTQHLLDININRHNKYTIIVHVDSCQLPTPAARVTHLHAVSPTRADTKSTSYRAEEILHCVSCLPSVLHEARGIQVQSPMYAPRQMFVLCLNEEDCHSSLKYCLVHQDCQLH